jgi:hypothetical protein
MSGLYPDNQAVNLFGKEISWPGVDPVTGKFTNGSFSDPLVEPSFIPAETINLIIDNLAELIAALGGSPNNSGTGQLRNAVLNRLAPLASPAFTGTPTKGGSEILAKSDVVNSLTGTATDVPLSAAQGKALNDAKAPLASPEFTGTPTVPTAAKGTSNTQAASTEFMRESLDTYFYVGKMIGQYPDEPTPVEAGYPGTWEDWSGRAIMYGLSTSALPSYSDCADLTNQTIAAGSRPYALYHIAGDDYRLYRLKDHTDPYVVPDEFDPAMWERYSTGVTIVERQKAGNALTAADYAIGTKIASGTYANRYVTEIIVPGGKFWGVNGGNRPAFISGGVQEGRIRNINGKLRRSPSDSEGWDSQVVSPPNSALYVTQDKSMHAIAGSGGNYMCSYYIYFDASRSVPTGPDFAGTNVSTRFWRKTAQ